MYYVPRNGARGVTSHILSYTHLLCVPWGFRLNDDLNEKEHRKTHVDKCIPSIVTKLRVSDMFLQKYSLDRKINDVEGDPDIGEGDPGRWSGDTDHLEGDPEFSDFALLATKLPLNLTDYFTNRVARLRACSSFHLFRSKPTSRAKLSLIIDQNAFYNVIYLRFLFDQNRSISLEIMMFFGQTCEHPQGIRAGPTPKKVSGFKGPTLKFIVNFKDVFQIPIFHGQFQIFFTNGGWEPPCQRPLDPWSM
jgi:hypothetical protein